MKVVKIIAWIAPFLAVPLYFFAVVGWGMSPSGPNANASELFMLAAGPVISLAAIAKVIMSAKKESLTSAGLLIPALLSLAELAFTILLLCAG